MKFSEVTIGSLALTESGAFKIGPFGSLLKKTEIVDCGIAVAGIENVLPNQFVQGFRRYITSEKYAALSQFTLSPNDVLVTTMGTIGRAAVVPEDSPIMIMDSHLFRMRVNQCRILPEYLAFMINSPGVQIQLDQNSVGAIMDGLNTSILSQCVIPLPLLSEQHRIAAILRAADHERRRRRYTQTLSDGVLGEIFVQMFGDPVTNPLGWETRALVQLIQPGSKINYGVVQPGDDYPGGVPIIRVGDFDDLERTTEHLKRIDPLIEAQYKQSRLIGDEILVACVGSIGKITLVDERLAGFNIVRAVAKILAGKSINRSYLAQYLRMDAAQAYFRDETRTVSQPTLNIEQIEKLPVQIPPRDLQREFGMIVAEHTRVRRQQQESTRQVDHLFDTLLHRAFAGEL